jgi:hypothetical protein
LLPADPNCPTNYPASDDNDKSTDDNDKSGYHNYPRAARSAN